MLQTFSVPAGGRQANAKATFFRYESSGVAGLDETLRVRADGQDLGTYLPGDSIELPAHAATWEFTPAAPTQTCVVRLGLGRVDSARLVGVVQVVDTARSLTEAGLAFFATVSGTAAAGNFTRAELANPAASGRKLIVTAVGFTIGAASSVFIGHSSTTDVVLNGGSKAPKLATAVPPTTVATINATSNAAALNAIVGGISITPNIGAAFEKLLREPMVLMPGTAAKICTTSAAVNLNGYFEFLDVPV